MLRARLAICLALRGEFDARLAPLDQAHAELVLELFDLHAEGRLADGAGLRGVAEMPGFRQRFEVAQLPERHHGDKGRLCFL